jgi:hypothetical protein
MLRSDRTPALSVILPTADDFSTIRMTVRALRAQTIRHKIELVIVVPQDDTHIPDHDVEGFCRVMVVNGGRLVTSNRSRVAGIRAATSPIVVLAEDHSFPAPDWAEALLDAHQRQYAVVGPVVRNGNPRTMLSWANLLLEYGPWLEGAERAELDDLPGHNSAYRRELLVEYGDHLEKMFEVEAVIQRDLRSKGHRMLLEPRACTSHLNFSKLRPSLLLRLNAGRSFAAYRTHGWSLPKRIAYGLASPLIPFVRLSRIVRLVRTSPELEHLFPRVLPMLCTVLLVDGLGELIGYTAGPGDSPRFLGSIEFNRVRFLAGQDRVNYQRAVRSLDESMDHTPRALAG